MSQAPVDVVHQGQRSRFSGLDRSLAEFHAALCRSGLLGFLRWSGDFHPVGARDLRQLVHRLFVEFWSLLQSLGLDHRGQGHLVELRGGQDLEAQLILLGLSHSLALLSPDSVFIRRVYPAALLLLEV